MSALIRRQVMRVYQLATGRRILDRLDELNRSQWLSGDELLALQRDKLHKLLVYAYQYVPYYRRTFDQVGFRPDEVLADLASLRKLPLLTKATIRENFDDMLTTESQRRARMSRHTTGGSTGHPLIFMEDTNFRDYFTADVHRHLGWGGWEFGQPHAYIGGGSFEVSKMQSMRAFANCTRRRRPRLLYGYASTLHHFAKFVRQNNFDDIQFQSVSSSAEVLYPPQRQFIEETFGCKVLDRYASLELGALGSQCQFQTGLHVSVESVYIEILDDNGQPTRPGEPGDIVVTNLNNHGMPFIRYCIEDIGAWHMDDTCPCGRALPMLELIQGRRIDMFKTKDGRTIWGGFASPLFGMEGVKRFQVVQKSLDLIVVRIVKEGELDQTQLDTIGRTVKIALGDDVEVRFEFPEEIPVLDSGKYRYAISEIDE
jgi:phenylacetate-CoA ligase